MPLVKSVYVLVHTRAQDGIRFLADEVQPLLDKMNHEGLAAAVEAIKAFWDTEIPHSTPAGRMWLMLLAKATATEMPLNDPLSYKAMLDGLLQDLGVFLRAAE